MRRSTVDGRAKRKPQASDEASGVIRADELYTLDAAKRRLGLTDSAWRASGIPHKPLGKRKFVLGRDVIAYMESLPDVAHSPGESDLA